MNRVCSLIAALALMSSMLMAQTSPTVPLGHWTYDVFQELEEAGVVHKLSGEEANTAVTRDQGADLVIEAMVSIRKKLEAQPDLSKLSRTDIIKSSGKEREHYQAISDNATSISKQAAKVSMLSTEFRDALLARSVDVAAFTKLCRDTEKAAESLETSLVMIRFKQDGPELEADHWAYDVIRKMIADGVLTGYRMPIKESCQHTTTNQFARMIMTIPAVMISKVAEQEAAVNRWCASVSQLTPDVETDSKLVSDGLMLSRHNAELVALGFEFQDELQKLGFNPVSIKKTAFDIAKKLNRAERLMNNARYTAQHPETAPPARKLPD
ncbi:MAG: hypothetical protein ACYC1M_13040 [Armatimonadota bacterium]